MNHPLITPIIDRTAPTKQPNTKPPFTNGGSIFDWPITITTTINAIVSPINPILSLLMYFSPLTRIARVTISIERSNSYSTSYL